MEKLKHYLRQNLVAVNIIIMLIGVISIFFSVYLPTPNLQTIVMGIGTSLFSSGLIVFITSLFVDVVLCQDLVQVKMRFSSS